MTKALRVLLIGTPLVLTAIATIALYLARDKPVKGADTYNPCNNTASIPNPNAPGGRLVVVPSWCKDPAQ